MSPLISFWSHALAAAIFVALLGWRLAAGARQAGHRLLLAAFALTALWAWLQAVVPHSPVAAYAETARNLVWVGLLYSLYASGIGHGDRSIRLVYGAVSAVLGLQFVVTTILAAGGGGPAVEEAGLLLRITGAAGSLVLVHNLYGQAAPSSRSNIRFAMLGLALGWTYELNLYTISYLVPSAAAGLADWRGLAVALTGPLFALAARREDDWRIRLSRAATFQSLSLLAICAYFAVMAVVATALRGTGIEWLRFLSAVLLALMVVGAMALLPSQRARSWAKVKIAKHLFEHRYDYRSEWLRFTDTLGGSGSHAGPLGERLIKAFADILDSPGGLLLEREESGAAAIGAEWNWIATVAGHADSDLAAFMNAIGKNGRIVELDAIRQGWALPEDRIIVPERVLDDERAWVCIPLIHANKAVGLLILAAPDYRRPLDWEDFDLLRTAGRQAASSLAEAQGQRALANAQRFEEFNRRFAFILHDVKNLVSQLSLLVRNAERHSDKEEFRADMIATLKGSIGKMTELMARLSQRSLPRYGKVEGRPLRDVVAPAVTAFRGRHDVRLLGDCDTWANVDPVALEQALRHLIQNAVEASPKDEPVIVRVKGIDGEIAVSICDRGCGMDSDYIRGQLFQPFVSTKAAGFGIGAFESRSLIEAMGGRISVESSPGKGSKFTLHLPAAQPPLVEQRKIA